MIYAPFYALSSMLNAPARARAHVLLLDVMFTGCLLSTVYCLLSTVYSLLSTVYCLLSTVYCLLSSVYCLYYSTSDAPPALAAPS